MKNLILSMLVLCISLLPLNASVYKGQKYFKKNCLSCHGKALVFVTEKSYDQWMKYLDVNGDVIYNLHNNVDEAALSMKYFNSQKYRISIGHYRDFFLEYANDTGNIPACE
ncbi:MAG: hypothetical protein H8E76_05845 [Helicobacteraceae bacterium]|nr:hypothetical protein [Candidatus Sulfurimonas ponti]MBL6973846.1 hypothetical protein [Sulfurimonas sp.]